GKQTLREPTPVQKPVLVSPNQQTPRNSALAMQPEAAAQIIFVTTPGPPPSHRKAINRYMNRAASSAIKDVDVVVFAVDKLIWTDEDEMVARQLRHISCPVIIAVNKVDQLESKEVLLPHLQQDRKSTRLNSSHVKISY